MWDAEESARRGFASPREWKERLTSREYEHLKAISRKWPTGPDRRDLSQALAAWGVMTAFGPQTEERFQSLFPIKPPEEEQTEEQILAALSWPNPSEN